MELFRDIKSWLNRNHYPTEEETQQFMQGYRYGFPLVGETIVEQTHAGTKEYNKGLKAGRRDAIPGIPFDDRPEWEKDQYPNG